MSLRLCGLLFLLASLVPSGICIFGNDGVEVRTCIKLEGLCFFGCPMGWKWVAYCHNVLSCCIRLTASIPPQSREPWEDKRVETDKMKKVNSSKT
ncbi:beta-defensin 136 [Carlito syrichta]|uniref:Beta-defensin 136 n=1 Tax=Carlito syrichta TaxID=1868482 RepID=A0A3Q0DCQ1_CARSF|nr:beta-defensin 136 [Carlito syrichta]